IVKYGRAPAAPRMSLGFPFKVEFAQPTSARDSVAPEAGLSIARRPLAEMLHESYLVFPVLRPQVTPRARRRPRSGSGRTSPDSAATCRLETSLAPGHAVAADPRALS